MKFPSIKLSILTFQILFCGWEWVSAAEQPSLLLQTPQNNSSYTPGSSRIKTTGARILLDGFGEFTEPLQIDRYIEFIGISTPTVSLRTNHADLWLNNTTKQLCTRFDDSSSGCLALGSAITGQFLVSPSTGLIGGVFASNLILSNQVSLSSGVMGSLPAASIAAGSLGSSVIASSLAVNSVYPGAVRPGVYSIAVSSAQFLYNQVSPSTGIAGGTLATNIILGNQVSLSTGVTGALPAASIASGNLGSGVIVSNQISLSTGVTGTLSDSSLSSNVALLKSTQTWSGGNTYLSSTTLNGPLLANSSVGTSGFVLQTNGAGSAPSWVATGTQVLFQVVMASTTTRTTTTSTSFVDTALTATITPSSTSHRIFIWVSGTLDQTNTTGLISYATIARGSTNLGASTAGFAAYTIFANGEQETPCSMTYVDSPATSSAVTYTVQIATNNGGGTAKWLANNSAGVIVLAEIL